MPYLPFEKLKEVAAEIYVEALRQMLVDSESRFESNFRLLALRSCVPYFFYEPEPGLTHKMHEIRKEKNKIVADYLYPFICELAHAESRHHTIKEEAQFLLKLINMQ